MAVITISREPYSGGSTLGKKIADRLGYSLFTKKDLTQIFMKYGLISFEDFYESPLSIWERTDELGMEYMNFLVKVIQNISKVGDAVILGRGSFAVFPGYRDVVNVRLWAPKEVRIARCMAKDGISGRKEALHALENQDKLRQSFLAHCFHVHKTDIPNAFDIVLNTSQISDDSAVELIAGTMENLDLSEAGKGLLTGDIPADDVLIDTIKQVMA